MTVSEKITEHVRHLPEPLQAEILDFVEYLESKTEMENNNLWSNLALSQALRGMEEEPFLYSEKTSRRL
ncbi:MAG: DUF2281 domain-containing protein [Chlamydiae bacterium]|nr:DUF2281 domain-containing protein [Chlamydiota bacterium]MBI3277984.1 DUF2281 domain-containing protein [Chlamydiota bacterium]